MNSIQTNASQQLDAKARDYAQKHRCDYRTALYAVTKADSGLRRRYDRGNADVRSYADALTAAQRAMALLVADPERTRLLAGSLIDHLAHQHIDRNRGDAADPAAAYRRALSAVKQEHPSLGVAAESGFIADTDFALLALLVPAVAGEVERGNYRQAESRCKCGERIEYCRGKKLAHQRNVSENDVKAFSACILDAKDKSEFDKLLCYYR